MDNNDLYLKYCQLCDRISSIYPTHGGDVSHWSEIVSLAAERDSLIRLIDWKMLKLFLF
jgi:hypothetical protein